MFKSLVCIVALTSFFYGCGRGRGPSEAAAQREQHTAAVREVLRLDKQYGQQLEKEVSSDRVMAVKKVVRSMRSIDLLNCPSEFQDAYLKHCYAWGDAVPYVEKYDGFSGDLTAFLEGLGGDNRAGNEGASVQKGIRDTALEVERIALRYGVQMKH